MSFFQNGVFQLGGNCTKQGHRKESMAGVLGKDLIIYPNPFYQGPSTGLILRCLMGSLSCFD